MGGSWVVTWCNLVDVSGVYYFLIIGLDYSTKDVDARDGGMVDHRNVICRILAGLFVVAKVPNRCPCISVAC